MPDPATEQIRIARNADISTVTTTLSRAVFSDPLPVALYPNLTQRMQMLPTVLGTLVAHAVGGSGYWVTMTDDGAGAAIWALLEAGQPVPAIAELETVCGPAGARWRQAVGALAARHSVEHSHAYLMCLGVDPDRQRGGIGTALLRHGLARLTEAELPVYAEPGNEWAQAWLWRHGFRHQRHAVKIADRITVHPMRRPPSAPGRARRSAVGYEIAGMPNPRSGS
jgi:ribosomal protein S18 acetylase RimI-like enzyme